jgi:hypothetical protein
MYNKLDGPSGFIALPPTAVAGETNVKTTKSGRNDLFTIIEIPPYFVVDKEIGAFCWFILRSVKLVEAGSGVKRN